MSVYVATFLAAGYLATIVVHVAVQQWIALLSVSAASLVLVAWWERGRWDLGLLAPPRRVAVETIAGMLFAAAIILAADAVILLCTDLRHVRGNGFPWMETLLVFVPAVLHEELLFRGYIFQKLYARSRNAAFIGTSALFAALHLGNHAVTWLGIFNIFLAGFLLAYAWERHHRLWLPIGLHFAWNLLSGPILGYEVSGYVAEPTVLRTVGGGAHWLTGGTFGMEGSAVMTGMEVLAIAALRISSRPRTFPILSTPKE